MPWLSRTNSAEERVNPMKSPRFITPSPNSAKSTVSFIPAMIDGSCGTSPAVQRKTTMQMMFNDMKVMAQNMRCLPEMMESMMSLEMLRSMFYSWNSMRDMGLQIVLVFLEMWIVIMALPAFLAMPGFGFMVLCCICASAIAVLSWPLNGDQVIRCTTQGQQTDQYAEERWIYINGAMTSYSQMQTNLQHLSSIFCRPMTGIHNRTNGLILDMISMLLSNILPVNRSTSTVMYSQLRDCLLNPSVRKVVIVSHGTGAAILSMALDRLHADLPIDVLSKIEIYTFGSAARHLSNPCLSLNSPMNPNPAHTRADGSIISPTKTTLASRGNRIEDTERVIPHIEHYALSTDFFACCGIMHHTRSVLDNTFCGREFIINPVPRSSQKNASSSPPQNTVSFPSRSGFLLSQYLNMLFPPTQNLSSNPSILDQKVEVDIQTAEKREFTAQGISIPPKPAVIINRTSMSKAEKRASLGSPTVGSEGVAQARTCAKECEGKTVRQLSRLWRYAGGARPVGEGVALMNGVGLGVGLNGQGQGMM